MFEASVSSTALSSILSSSTWTSFTLSSAVVSSSDIIDQASSQAEKNVEMRTLNRQRKLLSKIEKAIKKIQENTYGYCEETGEPIGLKRLIARPIASLTIEAQEKHEKNEKIFADL